MIDWDMLNQIVTRKRAKEAYIEGEVVNSFDVIPAQSVQATIQPYVSNSSVKTTLKDAKEGVVQELSHVMYCNFVTSADTEAATATDILFLDRIIDQAGESYRVVFAVDDGGIRDHMKVGLYQIAPSFS